jgi:hypothetical protein
MTNVNETMVTLALNRLHTELYRIYEIWLEVGNGDMSVLENRMDKTRDEFINATKKYLSDAEQTKLFVKAYEDTLIAVVNS